MFFGSSETIKDIMGGIAQILKIMLEDLKDSNDKSNGKLNVPKNPLLQNNSMFLDQSDIPDNLIVGLVFKTAHQTLDLILKNLPINEKNSQRRKIFQDIFRVV